MRFKASLLCGFQVGWLQYNMSCSSSSSHVTKPAYLLPPPLCYRELRKIMSEGAVVSSVGLLSCRPPGLLTVEYLVETGAV